MAINDTVRELWKDNALSEHRGKSEAELQQIILNNARIVTGLGSDPHSVAEGYKLLGINDACQ